MQRTQVAGAVLSAAIGCLWPGQSGAQECVQWSVYSCERFSKGAKPSPRPEDRMPISIQPLKGEVPLNGRSLYRVELICEPTQRLPAPRQGLFSRTDIVFSHIVAITDQSLTQAQLPTQAKVLIPVYSFSTQNANSSRFINEACSTSFFLPGNQDLFVTATANQTENKSPSIITSLFFTGLKIFNPIAPLLIGSEAAALLKPSMEGIGATEAPLKELFSHFSSGRTETKSYRLYVGERSIRSQFSRITVRVQEIPSIIQTDDRKFVTSFEKLLSPFWEKLAAAKNDEKANARECGQFGNQLLAQTFPPYDVAYALSYVTRLANLDKKNSVACIGDQYGTQSVMAFTCPPPATDLKCLWNRFPDPLTLKDFTRPYPIQSYDESFFKGVRHAMADYAAANGTGGDDLGAELGKFFENEIDLVDEDRLLVRTSGKMSPSELMQKLAAKGFVKFGCVSKDAESAGMLFGFPEKPKAGEVYASDELVTLRNWQNESKKIFRVKAVEAVGLVEAVARPTLMYCGKGLRLEPPKLAEAERDAGPKKAEGQ